MMSNSAYPVIKIKVNNQWVDVPIMMLVEALGISYDNSESGLTAETVQDAIDEVVSNLGNQGGEQVVESDEMTLFYIDDGSGYGGSLCVFGDEMPQNILEIKDILFHYNDEWIPINQIARFTLEGTPTPTFVQLQHSYNEADDLYCIGFVAGIYGSSNALINTITSMEIDVVKIRYTEATA